MITTTRPYYTINKDISLEMFMGDNNSAYVAIYNDHIHSSVAFKTSVDNMKGLADFIYKNLENK